LPFSRSPLFRTPELSLEPFFPPTRDSFPMFSTAPAASLQLEHALFLSLLFRSSLHRGLCSRPFRSLFSAFYSCDPALTPCCRSPPLFSEASPLCPSLRDLPSHCPFRSTRFCWNGTISASSPLSTPSSAIRWFPPPGVSPSNQLTPLCPNFRFPPFPLIF